jgi:hypothetical protein
MSSFSVFAAFDGLAIDLPSGVESELLGANGVDVGQADKLIIAVKEDGGAHAIDGLTLYEMSPGASSWDPVAVSPIPVAAGKESILVIEDHAHGRVRLTAKPTNHVSADVHARAVRKDL